MLYAAGGSKPPSNLPCIESIKPVQDFLSSDYVCVHSVLLNTIHSQLRTILQSFRDIISMYESSRVQIMLLTISSIIRSMLLIYIFGCSSLADLLPKNSTVMSSLYYILRYPSQSFLETRGAAHCQCYLDTIALLVAWGKPPHSYPDFLTRRLP